MADTTYTIILKDSGVKAFTMPQGYWPDVQIYCWGAGGGNAERSGVQGGGGGYAQTTINIYQGDEVSLQIGQPGAIGYNSLGGQGGLDTSYRLFHGGNAGGVNYDDWDHNATQGGGGGGASWVAVNGTYVCVGAGGGGGGGGASYQTGAAGQPGGTYTKLNSRSQGSNSNAGYATGGGGGAGYPYGGVGGQTVGDDAGGGGSGSGGQNYGNVTVAGNGTIPGGLDSPFFPSTLTVTGTTTKTTVEWAYYRSRLVSGSSFAYSLVNFGPGIPTGQTITLPVGQLPPNTVLYGASGWAITPNVSGTSFIQEYWAPTTRSVSITTVKNVAYAGYPGYIVIVLRKKLNVLVKNPDASGNWINIQSAYVKVGEARPSVVSDIRTFNTIGSSTYVIPKEIKSLTVSYSTPSGPVSQIIPVTSGGIIPVTVGDVGQASSFGDFTMPAYNKQVFQYIGNVDHLLDADVQIATTSGNPLTTAGYNAEQAAAAASAGISYNVTYEGWHGDLYSTLYFTPVAIGNLTGKFQIVTDGGGRYGAPTVTAQPTVANGYVMSIQFYDPGGGEGGYNGTFTLQQQGNFTISYNLPVVITPWKQLQQAFTKVGNQWKPILTNKTIDLYNYPVKRVVANIVISSNTSSYDLYSNIPMTYFEGLMDIDVWVLPGVEITGSSTETAFTITGFTDGDRITLHNYGTIIGLGGTGGSGSYTYQVVTSNSKGGIGGYGKGNQTRNAVAPAGAGGAGGTGLLLGFPTILLNNGVIAGGGGGGGGGGYQAGGQGGGGAGYGSGANGGTVSAGGAGAGSAGAGGGPGSPGAAGTQIYSGAGGNPGYSIQGVSNVVTGSSLGSYYGPVAG
jgi:hypothetical protein